MCCVSTSMTRSCCGDVTSGYGGLLHGLWSPLQSKVGVTLRMDPGSRRSAAGRAAALGRLLKRDCARLLELYKETAGFLSDVTLAKDRIIPLPPPSPHLSSDERVQILYSALRQCLELLEAVMSREKEELGIEEGGQYERMRNTVKDRFGHLLHSTKLLLVDGERSTSLTPQAELTDGFENGSSFALKIWIYRVLQELIHWTHWATETFLTLQSEQEKEPEKLARKRKRSRREKRST